MLTTCRVIQLAGGGARIVRQVEPWRWCAYFDSKLPLTWEAGQWEPGDWECCALLSPSPASGAISPCAAFLRPRVLSAGKSHYSLETARFLGRGAACVLIWASWEIHMSSSREAVWAASSLFCGIRVL